MKVLIVGGVAGGATTATRLRRLDEKCEIILFEKGNFISFANCGLPYYIGDVIKDKEDLLLQTPKSFKERFNIDVRIKEEVIKIDRKEKKVKIKNIQTGEIYVENYDKLVLSPGAEPINPFKSIETEKIKTLRTVDDSINIKKYIEKEKPKHIAIIGGGYIGVEMAENINRYKDIKVSIIEKSSHLIAPLDDDMASFVHKKLLKNNVELFLKNGVQSIKAEDERIKIELEKGNLDADFVILCIGVKPESDLASDCKLDINSKESIMVNEYLETNDRDIYALGDAVQVQNFVTKNPAYIPLAGPANKQARVVANNICGNKTKYEGTIGSSILKIYDNNLGLTGINESTCISQNIKYKIIIISPYSHATYYPGASQLTIKVVFDPDTAKILGAQVWGKESVDKITDILASAIRMNMTAYDLEELELCYAPPFSSAKSPINILGNAIENDINGLVDNITWNKVEKLKDAYILDVRTEEEYNYSHINIAKHIPLDELRDRINELDKQKTIFVYCHTGLRSYIACRILNQNGFKTKNITGGYYFYTKIKK